MIGLIKQHQDYRYEATHGNQTTCTDKGNAHKD
jgi:hypothetical protein